MSWRTKFADRFRNKPLRDLVYYLSKMEYAIYKLKEAQARANDNRLEKARWKRNLYNIYLLEISICKK